MKRRNLYLFLLLSLPFGVFNLWKGQSVEFDLFLYHFYLPFFSIENRIGHDIDAAHLQTYLNPAMDFAYYLFNKSWGLNAAFYGFFQGWFQGITCFIYFKIYEFLSRPAAGRPNEITDGTKVDLLCIVLAVLSTCTPVFLDLLGTTFNDITASLFWLLAFYLLLTWRLSPNRILAAGFFAGFGSGLKLTLLLNLVALTLFIPIVLRFRVRPTLKLGVGVVVGLFASTGWWCIFLYRNFGNPIFPLYNNVFPNKFMTDLTMSPQDANLWVQTWRDLYRIPIYLLDNHTTIIHQYHPFKDARLLAMFVMACVCVVVGIWRRKKTLELGVLSRLSVFTVAFWIIAYLLWFKISMVWRYFIVGDQLIPILLFGMVYFLGSVFNRDRKLTIVSAASALLFVLFLYQRSPQTYHYPWQSDVFRIQDKPALAKYKDSMVLMVALDNQSYVIPYFPLSTRFVRIQGSLDWLKMKSETYAKEIRSVVNEFKGPLYAMQLNFPDGSLNYPPEMMRHSKVEKSTTTNSAVELYDGYGFKVTKDCHSIETLVHRYGELTVCRLERKDTPKD